MDRPCSGLLDWTVRIECHPEIPATEVEGLAHAATWELLAQERRTAWGDVWFRHSDRWFRAHTEGVDGEPNLFIAPLRSLTEDPSDEACWWWTQERKEEWRRIFEDVLTDLDAALGEGG